MIEPSEDSFETMMELKNPSSKQMESSEGSSNTVEEMAGSSGAQAEAGPASGPDQASKEPPSGSLQEMQELPIDLLQDMEEPSSGPHKEIEDPPNDLLQDMEESCYGSTQARADPPSGGSDRMKEASVNPFETQVEQGEETNLKEEGKEGHDEEESLPQGTAREELMAENLPQDDAGEELMAENLPQDDAGEELMAESLPQDDDGEELMAESLPQGASGDVLDAMTTIISLFFRMQDLNEQQRVAEEILARGINAGQLPTPTRFSGDRREYHEFIVLCQMILQSYPRMFYSDQLRVKFVVSHMTGLALEWAEELIQNNSPLLSNFPGFLAAMSEMFEYRQTLRVAEDAMLNIRQGNRCASDYINEFQSLIPTLGWPDEVLQAHLCQGLNEDIRHCLFRIPQPDSLDSLIVLILQIEDKLEERRAILRLPPESRPRHLAWLDSPASEKWMVSSWLPNDFHPDIDRAHLFLLLLVRVNPYHSVAVRALVDSGAEGNFMDEQFAQEHYVELYEKPYPQSIQTVDGSLIGDEPVWLYTEPLVCIHQNHQESLEFDIVPSPNFSVVLGINWLRTHAPEVDWVRGRCTFHSPYCLKNCFRPPPPCIALERYSISLLPGLPHPYSDLADVFNPREVEEISDQPSSDGSDDLSESEPSELQQAGDSDHSETFYECPSTAPWEPVGARMQEEARRQEEYLELYNMLTNTRDRVQMIPELFNQLHGAVWFTRLVLRGTIVEEARHHNRTEEAWRVAFGLELSSMESYRPFPLSSDPIIPQSVIHFILKDMLGIFVISYGREVLVYSMCQEEHVQHVRRVLVRFRRHNVYCSLDRTQFHRHTAEIMGFIVTPKGVKLNKGVITFITGYPTPGTRRCLQSMIEYVFPYRHFVEHFAMIAEPLVRQVLSADPFYWGAEEQEALECLKRAFRKAPILYHPKPQNTFYLETGIRRSCLYASLIQADEHTNKRVTCAFHSRVLTPTEVEYPQVEMRILAIRAAFMVWCRYLENTEEPIMILLNTEDLASLNNDRLTVLLPGHWMSFFSHFHFDVMELPDPDSRRPLTPRRSRNQRGFRGRACTRPMLLFAMRGAPSDRGPGGEEEDGEDDSDQEGLVNEQTLLRELVAAIPINQILNGFLAHFGMAQIRAVVLHFFRGLLYWKNLLGLATLLVILRVRHHLALLPTHSLEVARPQPRRSLRLILDSTLMAGSTMATAIAQLLSQMPPLVGANTFPAQELAELFLGPRHWQRNALNVQPPWGLRFTPGFWLTLCEIFGVRVTPPEVRRPALRQHRYLELHMVGDEDVVLREALQDDLQRYRQCGLHDGLQDTSQDDVAPEALPGDHAAVQLPFRPRNLLDPEVLDLLNNRLLYIRGTDGRLTLLSREQVARALARFLTMISTQTLPPAPPREEATLEELPDLGDDDLD